MLQTTLETEMNHLMADYGLDESNFSICYYNTVTAESYEYNADAWMVAGSTYKLPLNMYYYELEMAGEISWDTVIAGYDLATIHYESIVYSNNELSEALLWNLGTYEEYKSLMFESYGDFSETEIEEIAWTGNYYTTGYMLDTLQYLYERSGQFTQLLGYMTEATPNAYFKKYIEDYEIAHKYGAYDTAENDVGIVYTDEPYLLAVYTYGLDNGEEVVAQINEAVCNYNVLAQTSMTEQQEEADIDMSEAEAIVGHEVEMTSEVVDVSNKAELLLEETEQMTELAAVAVQRQNTISVIQSFGKICFSALGIGLVLFLLILIYQKIRYLD